jgi:hypothetical protein
MFATQFMQLLGEGGIAPVNVARLDQLLERWYAAEPSLPTFVLRAVFRELSGEWDDPQGLPAAMHDPFEQRFLPALRRVAPLMGGGNRDQLNTALEDVVRAFHACSEAARRAAP